MKLIIIIIKKYYGCKRLGINNDSKPSQRLIPRERERERESKAKLAVFSQKEQITPGHLYVKQRERETLKFIYCCSSVV